MQTPSSYFLKIACFAVYLHSECFIFILKAKKKRMFGEIHTYVHQEKLKYLFKLHNPELFLVFPGCFVHVIIASQLSLDFRLQTFFPHPYLSHNKHARNVINCVYIIKVSRIYKHIILYDIVNM